MYKKMLVPLDGSKGAESILPHVEELAFSFKAKLILLHVVEYSSGIVGPHGTLPELYLEPKENTILEAKRYLLGIHGEFREKNIMTRTFVEEGIVVSTIISVANREDVDLIAMASHGRTGLAHVYYGSVAAGVLHRIERPLLLIRTRSEFLKMKD